MSKPLRRHAVRRRPTWPRRSRGQALVEFALVLPVFLLLVLIAIDFGRLFFSYIEVNNAAREAAAYGAGSPTDTSGMLTHATQETNSQAQRGESPLTLTPLPTCEDATGATIACGQASGGGGAGNTISVNVAERFSFLTPLVNNFFGGGVTMNASATAAVLAYAPSGGGTQPGACAAPSVPSFTVASSNLTVNLDPSASQPNSGTCAISGYNWKFGDGVQGVGTPSGTSHTYAAAGTYTITLTVTNQGGSGTASQTVTVPSGGPTCLPPTASFSQSPAPPWKAANNGGQQATLITFDGSATTNMTLAACHPSWSWNYGDATAAGTTATVKHSYAHSFAGKSVTITLTATNDAGTSTATYSTVLQ